MKALLEWGRFLLGLLDLISRRPGQYKAVGLVTAPAKPGWWRWGKAGEPAEWVEGEKPEAETSVAKPPAAQPAMAKPPPAAQKDELLLAGVHPDLVRVVLRARRDGADFRILEGLRTRERQAQLLHDGKSQTMNSRHLTGHAVDLAPMAGGFVSWDWKLYHPLAARMKAAAAAEGVPVEWGGDWRTLRDGPHWQLPHASYPATGKA